MKKLNEMQEVEHVEDALDLTTLQASLSENKIDAIVVTNTQANEMVKANKDLVKVVLKEEFQSKNQYVVAMEEGIKEDEESLYQEVEKTISKLQQDTKEAWMKNAQ